MSYRRYLESFQDDLKLVVHLRVIGSRAVRDLGLDRLDAVVRTQCYGEIVQSISQLPVDTQFEFWRRVYSEFKNGDDVASQYVQFSSRPILDEDAARAIATSFLASSGSAAPERILIRPTNAGDAKGIYELSELDFYVSRATENGRLSYLVHVWNCSGNMLANRFDRASDRLSIPKIPGDTRNELSYCRLQMLLRAGMAEIVLSDLLATAPRFSHLVALITSGFVPARIQDPLELVSVGPL